jgi:hypothetical protein
MTEWTKLGRFLEPSLDVWWMATHTGPSFIREAHDHLELWVTGRCKNNISRIGVVHLSLEDPSDVLKIEEEPRFDVGETGCFDERGVSYPWIVEDGKRHFMYYTGWVQGGLSGFQNFTGLAVSEDDCLSFTRYSRAPILDRTDQEPIGSGSVCVIRESDRWRMWYTSFDRWETNVNSGFQHFYNIKYAESSDGVRWNRTGSVAIDFNHAGNHTIGKPMVLCNGGLWRMWYSYRGDSYRIGYAESPDCGRSWIRSDSQVGIDVSETGWDSQMIEYAYVFERHGLLYMIYCGNDFGKSGLGIAVSRTYHSATS